MTKLGIIGCGDIATRHAKTIQGAVKGITIAAVKAGRTRKPVRIGGAT